MINNRLGDSPNKEKDEYTGSFHYGRFDLRELMDFIYERKPRSEDEYISSGRKL